MAVPNLLNTWKVVMNYHCGLTKFQNVLHVTADTLSDPKNVATDVAAAWTTAGGIFSKQSSQVFGDHIFVQPYDGATAPFDIIVPTFNGTPAGGAATVAPAQVSLIGTLRTLTSGRSHRGRIYVGGMQSNGIDTTGAQWASATMAAFQTCFDNFLTTLASRTTAHTLVVYSSKTNTKTNVNNILARQYFGTQRRRAEQRE